MPKVREDKQGEAIYPIRMTSFLTSYEWAILPHLAYSPDISPPYFDLHVRVFPKLEEPLRGIRRTSRGSGKLNLDNQLWVPCNGCRGASAKVDQQMDG